MSLILVPLNSGYPTEGFSLPDLVSFCIADDGTGGELLVGMGVTEALPVGGVDLKAAFLAAGLLFNSTPLMSAFRLLTPTASSTAAMNRLVPGVDVTVVPAASSQIYELPIVLQTEAGGNFPYVAFSRPNGGEAPPTGVWRVDIRLRHSIAD